MVGDARDAVPADGQPADTAGGAESAATTGRTLSGQPTIDRTLSGQPTIDATLSGQDTAVPTLSGLPTHADPAPAATTADRQRAAATATAIDVAALAPGSRFAGYLVEGQLGQGGMGVVYRARHAQMSNRVAALKVMRPEAATGDFAVRFLREANSAAAVNHPNVVGVYDFGEWQGVLFMAMEFVPGGDLSALIKAQGALPVAHALAVLRDCARGLGAIHEAGLVHRDIKPHNIFLDVRGRAKLGDLGLARAVDADDERVTLTGGVLGTPAYMSPEQAAGASDLDIRSDIHALGATLYAMLTGRAPFAGSTPYVVVNQVLSAARPRISALNPAVPPAVEALALTAMAIDRAQRQGDPAALLAAIDAAATPASTADAGTAPALPAAIDGYPVEAALGQGGMGAVYRVRDRNTGLPLALKTIRLDLGVAATLRPRFRQEYGLLQRLNHPSIVRVFGMGEDPAHGLYYTMELLAGDSLHARRAAAPPAPAEAVRWWRQIAGAILAAHDAGVLHRDLKPQNVVFRVPGQPVVVDFGLGGHSDAAGGRTLARGTRAWAPPEQGEGQTSHATDVYGLAAILVWLLTGALPGPARGRVGDLIAQAGPPRPLLAAALERALAPLPARFLTVDELVHAVEQALAAAPLVESAAPSSDGPARADRMVARAGDLLRAGDRTQAAQVCERVLHDEPGHAGAACCLLVARHDAGAFRAAARLHAQLATAAPDHPLWRKVEERLARCGDGPLLHAAPAPMAYCFPERALAAGERVRELYEYQTGHLNPGDLGVLAIELLEADTPHLGLRFAAISAQEKTLGLIAGDLTVELRYRVQPARRGWFGLGGRGGHPPMLCSIAVSGAPFLRLAFAHTLAVAAGTRLGRDSQSLCRDLGWTGLDLVAARAGWEAVLAPLGG